VTPTPTPKNLADARILWDYLRLGMPLQKSGCILAMGSHDVRVGEYAARLYLEGWAPLLVCSGGRGALTRDWQQTEAELFAAAACRAGVPPEAILIEDRSSNTGENVTFTRRLLEERGLQPGSFLLVHKPYMERRAITTFRQQWPGVPCSVTSPPIAFKDYPTPEIPMLDLITIMVGDFQRIERYAELGLQEAQIIPTPARQAFERLVQAGFNGRLVE